jgi:hypothetical protein
MNILQHNPMSFFVSLLYSSTSNFVLTLTKRNTEEWFSSFNSVSISISFNDLLNLFHRIWTRWKNEENRDLRLRVCNNWSQDIQEGWFWVHINILFTFRENVSDKSRKGHCYTIWTQTPKYKQFFKGSSIKLFPFQWKFNLFWLKFIVPIFESGWRIFLHILCKCFELLKLCESLNHVPWNIRQPVKCVLSSWSRDTFN